MRPRVIIGGGVLLALALIVLVSAHGSDSSRRSPNQATAAVRRSVAPNRSPSRIATGPRHAAGAAAVVRAGGARERLIALTFDDGPSPYTPEIVRILVRMRAPATFFLVGQQLRYFAAGLRTELAHGFELGDHTENHAWLIRLAASAQYEQISRVAVAMTRLGAPFPRLFRPPYGSFDARTLAILGRLRMTLVMWSIDPRDWLRPGTKTIVRRVLAAARPGAIVEMHDGGGNRGQTVAALPAIIHALRHRHYRFVTVSGLLAVDPPCRSRGAVGYSAAPRSICGR